MISEVEWMGFFPFRRRPANEVEDINQCLRNAQAGDEHSRNAILRDYVPFVAKVASQVSKRYIRQGQDDEFSIALTALNEAIDRYDPEKGASFLSFAETVIKRRLIDYFRTKTSRNRDIPLTEFETEDDEENVVNFVEVQKSLEEHARRVEQQDREEEILRYSALLAEFDIDFEDLIELSPKHADARQNAMDVARVIVSDPNLVMYVFEKKALPLKQLTDRVNVSRKTLERQRKYILAITLILSGDFTMLQEYIQ
jgi:RNA polymerase sigma factor